METIAFLGIDIGTTGTKSILFDSGGKILGKGYKDYPLINPQEGFFEQNAQDWYGTVVQSVKTAVNGFDGRIKGMSFSAQGGSFLFCEKDENGKLISLTNALTWLDKRAYKEAEELSPITKKINGQKVSAGSALSRFFWIKKNMPQAFERVKLILSTSDYVYYRLTGKAVIDNTSAAMMGVYDNENNCWDERLLNVVGITADILPKIICAGDLIGKASKDFL